MRASSRRTAQARPEEDAGAVRRPKRGEEPIFVVQRHDARRLHYDFRLERDGALASLGGAKGRAARARASSTRRARRGPSARVRDVRGRDPKGSYGAGTVEIWDSGTYELVEEKPTAG